MRYWSIETIGETQLNRGLELATLVLGAGIIGTTTGYYLARDGEPVTIVDRQAAPGLETSFANGGLVTPSMSDPWAAPGVPLQVLKWLGDEEAPFLLRFRAIPGLLGWSLRFLRNCNETQWRRTAETMLRLTSYSCDALDDLSGDTGLTHDRSTKGTLKVFRDAVSMEAATKSAELLGQFGLDFTTLDAAACLELEPALASAADRVAGGVHYPGDRSGDAHKFTQELARLAQGIGATFQFDTIVEALIVDGNRIAGVRTNKGVLTADTYVLALASDSVRIGRSAGLHLPIYPAKGYSVTFSAQGQNNLPSIPIIDDGRKIAVTPYGDRIRVAGTVEFTGYDKSVNPRRGSMLLKAMAEVYPDIRVPEDPQHWCGLRPMTPDDLPIMGPTRFENLVLNTGHGHLGWTLACGSGRMVADHVLGRKPQIAFKEVLIAR